MPRRRPQPKAQATPVGAEIEKVIHAELDA
jgi:hypothetical protein